MTIVEIIICAIGGLWFYLIMGTLCTVTMEYGFELEGRSYLRVISFLFWPIFFVFGFIALPFWVAFYDDYK